MGGGGFYNRVNHKVIESGDRLKFLEGNFPYLCITFNTCFNNPKNQLGSSVVLLFSNAT